MKHKAISRNNRPRIDDEKTSPVLSVQELRLDIRVILWVEIQRRCINHSLAYSD